MLWAISDHGKIMLEVLLEAQVAKIEQKFVFPIWNKQNFYKKQKS